MLIEVPVSVGELVDKITILEVKKSKLSEEGKIKNVVYELDLLRGIFNRKIKITEDIQSEMTKLRTINAQLWDIEDAKRACERASKFDDDFVQLARQVYLKNDERARIKRQINDLTGSTIVEEKSHR